MSGCYCDYEPAEFLQRKTVTARKDHSCEECGCIIRTGERYEYTFGKWEGCTGEFKTCLRCVAVREYVQANVPCFCWAHGNTLEDARETIDEYAHELPGLWFGWARRHIAVINHIRQSGAA